MKKIFGILGYPVNHSLSPAMHNAAFKALNIEAEYQLFAVKPEELKTFIDRVRRENMAGLSVTIPHKITVMAWLDEVDDKAKAIGAVNTIINKNGLLIGTNTDCDGAINAFVETQNFASLRNQRVVIFGAGGAARAIAYGLREQGANVVILNRDLKKAQQLAEKYGFTADIIENCYKYPADVIIQTTPVGMEPNSDESIVPIDYLKPGMMVFDIVYKPKMTKLLQQAEIKGCQIVTGDKMLLYQAVKQFELFTGKKAPVEVVRKALELVCQ